MGLVDYSDSEEEQPDTTPPAKKRRVSEPNTASKLPPLPTAFHDLYSSTVRTSTRDDPALHGGRKRVMPHVEGNWPTHVYLEWHPKPEALEDLSSLINIATENSDKPASTLGSGVDAEVHSLLHNELGVPLPLHISLSRPLVLKTKQKDDYLTSITSSLSGSGVRSFCAEPAALRWHPNEDKSRWFLVLQLRTPETAELKRLLQTCNAVAEAFGQPLLYTGNATSNQQRSTLDGNGQFHISIAWSLKPPTGLVACSVVATGKGSIALVSQATSIPLPHSIKDLRVSFGEVKVRIGQDVETIPLKVARRASNAVQA